MERLNPTDTFVRRHLGGVESEVRQMLETVGAGSLEELVDETVPASIRRREPLHLAGLPEDRALGEREMLESLHRIASENRVLRSWLGMGYHGCITPGVIQRNILENPGWYTQYTPYQSEIAQGRLEALLNFQTMVADLTGLPVANASLLDEGTAAAEAMHMCYAVSDGKRDAFFVAEDCHPQTIAVVKTRAGAIGVEIQVGDSRTADLETGGFFGVLLQYPTTDGRVVDYASVAEKAHAGKALVVVAADLLALTLLRAPGELRRRRGRGLGPALRRAHGLRRPARGLPRHARRVQAPAPRPGDRRLARPPRADGFPHGDPDPRAAHPPREGHEQHLHGPGAPRHHGRHVCRLPRSRGAPGASPGGSTPWRPPWPRGCGGSGLRWSPGPFFDTLRVEHGRADGGQPPRRRRGPAGSTCASWASGRSASPSTRRRRRRTSTTCWRSSPARRRTSRRRIWRRTSTSRSRRPMPAPRST